MQTSQDREAKQARGIFPLVTGQDLRHTRIRRLARALVKYMSEPGFELKWKKPTVPPPEVPAAQSLRCSNVTSSRVTGLFSGACQVELRCLLLNFLFFKHPDSPSFTDKYHMCHLELPTSSGQFSGISHPGPRHALLLP